MDEKGHRPKYRNLNTGIWHSLAHVFWPFVRFGLLFCLTFCLLALCPLCLLSILAFWPFWTFVFLALFFWPYFFGLLSFGLMSYTPFYQYQLRNWLWLSKWKYISSDYSCSKVWTLIRQRTRSSELICNYCWSRFCFFNLITSLVNLKALQLLAKLLLIIVSDVEDKTNCYLKQVICGLFITICVTCTSGSINSELVSSLTLSKISTLVLLYNII